MLPLIGAAVMLPALIWASARLAPLAGVFLRERTGIFDGMGRAWALSKGSAGAIVRLVLVVAVMSFALSAFQLGLVRMGFVSGISGFLVVVVIGGLAALLLVYEAAGLGFLYRRLVEREVVVLAA